MDKILIFESRIEAERSIPINQVRKLRIQGQSYCMTQIESGFILFESECPHSGHDLSDGKVNHLGEIVCPSHAYRFDLNTGDADRPCRALKIFKLIWDDDSLYLEL